MYLMDQIPAEGHIGPTALALLADAMSFACRSVAEPARGPLGIVVPPPVAVMPPWMVLILWSCFRLRVIAMGSPRGSGAQVRPSSRGRAATAVQPLPGTMNGRGRLPPPGGAGILELAPPLVHYLEKAPRVDALRLLRRGPSSWRGSEARVSLWAANFGTVTPTSSVNAADVVVIGGGQGRTAPNFAETLGGALNLGPLRGARPCTARRRFAPLPPAMSTTGGMLGCQPPNSGMPRTATCGRQCMATRRASLATVPTRRPRGSACERRRAAAMGPRAGARSGLDRAAGLRANNGPAAIHALQVPLATLGGHPLAGLLSLTDRP